MSETEKKAEERLIAGIATRIGIMVGLLMGLVAAHWVFTSVGECAAYFGVMFVIYLVWSLIEIIVHLDRYPR